MNDELALLSRANPVSSSQPPRELDARARADLDRILASPVPARRPARRWVVSAALAATAALVFTVMSVVTDPQSQSAYAATPPALVFSPVHGDPASVLGDLAHSAEQTAPSPKASTELIRTQEWSLFTRVDGKTITSAVVPVSSELRWTDDHSGSLRRVLADPYFPNRRDERAWQDAGRPGKAGTVLTNQTFAPGQYRPMWDTEPPSTTAAMADYLAIGHPIAKLGTAELFVAVGDLARERTLTPAQRAAVLRVLAQAPDTMLLGAAIDRLSRPAVAIATDSSHSGLITRHILLFDPATGALNAQEQWLTTSAGALNVPIPSVISYTAWRH